MKSYLLFAMTFLLFFSQLPNLQGQNMKPRRLFQKGESDLIAGFGLLPTFLKDNIKQTLPPLTLRFENRLGSNYSLGLEVAHSITKSERRDFYSDEREYRNSFYHVALRNTAHCNCETIDNWDIYSGFSLGLSFAQVSVIDGTFGPFEKLHGIKPHRTQVTFYGFLGARYACTARLSFFGEIGYGASIIQAGLGIKL